MRACDTGDTTWWGSLSARRSPGFNELPDCLTLPDALASNFQECLWISHQRCGSTESCLLEFVGSGHLLQIDHRIFSAIAGRYCNRELWTSPRSSETLCD